MSLWLEHKYVLQAGMYLEQFKQTDENTFRFRCPLCGDSKKSKTLCRGYIFVQKDHYEFKCHNCGVAFKSVGNFFSRINPELYNQYRRELLITKYDRKERVKKATTKPSKSIYEAIDSPFGDLEKLSSLGPLHPAKQYLTGRQIPSVNHWKLFYCPDFSKWVNKLIPGKLDLSIKEDRILIPLYDEDKTFRGAQGRSLDPACPDHKRYMSVILDKSTPVLYNAENADFTRKYYALEGPFDSMFLPNAVAMLTATSNYPFKNRNNCTFVLDNQPRNPDVVKQYNKHIEHGDKVTIWPHYVEQKDVNAMIKEKEVAAIDVQKLIDENTYSGLEAIARFKKWKKV